MAHASELLKKKRILFMGTPDFSVPSLSRLCEENCEVVGVVTQEDRPSGRGYALKAPPVKQFALEKGIPVYQPENLKKVNFEALLGEIDPKIILVVAFGKILPPYVINYPEFGCVNLHGSLLPKYRGAAPMQRAIIDGEGKTGITVMKMDKGLDTGDMFLKKECEIGPEDNFETIHDRLSLLASDAMIEALNGIVDGSLIPEKQDDSLSTYAEKITNEDCLIDFKDEPESVVNRIRGLSPIPLAYSFLNGKRVKIAAAEKSGAASADGKEPGEVLSTDGGKIHVRCGSSAIALLSVQAEGKRRMSSSDFINGRNVKTGDVFSATQL